MQRFGVLGRTVIVLLIIIGFLLAILFGFLAFMMITNYRPDKVTRLQQTGEAGTISLEKEREYSLVTFNIGYCALGKEQDFFMDGGKNAGADSEEEVTNNLNNILSFLRSTDTDFMFLQEVDEEAKRSKKINQKEQVEALEGYASSFAYNFNVRYVPIPIGNAMGGVKSGIMTLSRYSANSADRYSFEGSESFPINLFALDRCFTITRIEADDGKELVLINAHFSAYDSGGKMREQQLAQMKSVLEEEYANGNYVIVGGDWNHELPGTDANDYKWEGEYPDWCRKLPDDFTPDGYTWAVGKNAPTCRNNEAPYIAERNFVVTIDGFLVSDNIEITEARTVDLEFEYSDHNPVIMKFVLL